MGNAVFTLKREKIDYPNVMVGVWQLYTVTQTAGSLTHINGTMMSLCGGVNGFYYRLNLVNGSYPTVSVKGNIASSCADRTFSTLMYSSSFFTVSANRSQLSFYDPSAKFLLKMNKVSNLRYNSSLEVNLRQAVAVPSKSNLNSVVQSGTTAT